MNNGLFTGIVKSSDLRHLETGKTVCNLWVEIQPEGETHSPFVLPVAAWDDLATEMAQIGEGNSVTFEGYAETEVVEKDGIKQKNILLTATRLTPGSVLTLIGRVGGDPEVKTIEGKDGSTTLAKVTLAVNKRKRDADDPDWFALEFWGRTAEIVDQYVRKGNQIGITGNLRIDSWKDRSTGDDRYKPVVRVSRLELLGSKQSEQSESAEPEAPTHQPTESAARSESSEAAAA